MPRSDLWEEVKEESLSAEKALSSSKNQIALTEGIPEDFEASLPENFYSRIKTLAPKAKDFLVPPSPGKEKALKRLHYDYNDGEGSRALAVRALLSFPKDAPYDLVMLFLYDDIVEKVADWDFCENEWEVFSEKYKAIAYVLPGEEIKIGSFLKYMSFHLVHLFYEEAAEAGFSDFALSLLGRAWLCNPNLDIKKIYNYAAKTEVWQEQLEKYIVEIVPYEKSTDKPVDKYSKFEPYSFRVFVDNKTQLKSSEKEIASYFWVFCCYKSLCRDGVNPEAILFLNNALQLNPALVEHALQMEGLRHGFHTMRGEVSAHLTDVRKTQKLFANYQVKTKEEKQEVLYQVYPLVFKVEETARKLEETAYKLKTNNIGAVGFFLSAQLYWTLGSFSAFVNGHIPNCFFPLIYFEKSLKNFYVAEFLSDNILECNLEMTIYSEFSHKDGETFRNCHARRKLFNEKTAMFFAPEQEARKKAKNLLQEYKPSESIVLPAAVTFASLTSSATRSCGFSIKK